MVPFAYKWAIRPFKYIVSYLTKHGENNCKVIIDRGSSMNIVSQKVVEHMKLKPEPHPQP